MVTSYNEAPLIFLTTSSAAAPTGRNARTHSRAQSAKRSNPAAAIQKGCFSSFSSGLKRGHASGDGNEQTRKKACPRVSSILPTASDGGSLEVYSPLSTPLRILATHFNPGCPPLPPNVNFEDVLRVAAFHIRRRAAQMIHQYPDRTFEALRCRQWCAVSSTFASLGRSPYLDSAIACVVSKVQQVVSGSASQQRMLLCYTEALHLLRSAIFEPSLHDRLDILAATQLLAIYEMLDFPKNPSWMQHVAGAAAMTKLQDGTHRGNDQAAPMFVEALLNNEESFFESANWRTLLQIIVAKQYPSAELTGETVSCFMALRSVFADAHSATRDGVDIDWPTRLPLLCRSHDLRGRLKSLILRSEPRFLEGRKPSKDCDVLGLCLISIMMLDRLILSLRQANAFRGHDLEEDTQLLCNRMIRLELNAAETHPGKEVLLAFRRQVNYPMLSYG